MNSIGQTPEKCQICGQDFIEGDNCVDGRTSFGPWAWMCESCHKDIGTGLGIGRGQLYNWFTGEQIKGGLKTGG